METRALGVIMSTVISLVTIKSLQREITWRREQAEYIRSMLGSEDVYNQCHNYINTVDEIKALQSELWELCYEYGKPLS